MPLLQRRLALTAFFMLCLPSCYETSGLFDSNGTSPETVGNGDMADDDDDSGTSSDDDDSGASDADDSGSNDADGDGFNTQDDCDDDNPQIFPGAAELCDEFDNNCNGLVDEGLGITLYRDYDGDGWGTTASAATVCPDSDGWVEQGDDCNDSHTEIYPGAAELCDALDNDCNGIADDGGLCPCEVNHYPNGMHPYMFCTQATTWYDAADQCIASGYRLVTFDSQDELTWATDQAIDIATSTAWWLGFNDAASEGTWAWEDASVVGFENWCSNEPNNQHGTECYDDTEEDCAMLNWGAGGCWNDYPCLCDQMFFICEGNSELRPQNLQ